MALHKNEKGLDLPISGKPLQVVRGNSPCHRVAILADDYPGMKPRMHVEEGETVRRGQVLFEDRKQPGVLHTAPGAGRIAAINRGERRALQSIVIELSDNEQRGEPSADELASFDRYSGAAPASLGADAIQALLVESGLWTALRQRPYSKVPSPESRPAALFITATDSNPLAPLPEVVLAERRADFRLGIQLVAKLTEGPTFFCFGEHSELAEDALAAKKDGASNVQVEEFVGPHPSGTVGYHIHTLMPVNRNRTVWHIGYQDVAAVGHLFRTGQLDVTRVISVAGPCMEDPRLEASRIGASVSEIVAAEIANAEASAKEIRSISGSVLSGKRTHGEIFDFMGRYEQQVSLLEEDRENVFLGWLSSGADLFSVTGIYWSKLFKPKKYKFTTNTNGSMRAMVPIGLYEKIMPFDLMPTFLLRALIVGDLERAESLGVLELDEEDLALCSYVCPGKVNYGPLLRKNLEDLEKEG